MVRVELPQAPRCPVCGLLVAAWDPQCECCFDFHHQQCGGYERFDIWSERVRYCNKCLGKEE